MSLPPGFVRTLILGWVTAIAIDFLFNAGVFASFFASGQPFILPRGDAFLRIPGGYASLFLLTLVLAVLIYRGKEARISDGFRTGLAYGTATSLATVLGLWSITTAPPAFLAIWLVDQILEMTAAGIVIVRVRVDPSRRNTSLVMIVVVICITVGLALQNLLT